MSNHQAKKLKAFGEEKTLLEWSKDPRCKPSKRLLAFRIGFGWPIEEAIVTLPRNHKDGVAAFGENRSVRAWAEDKRCVVGASALRGRLAMGWDAETAITTPIAKRTSNNPTVFFKPSEREHAYLQFQKRGEETQTATVRRLLLHLESLEK